MWQTNRFLPRWNKIGFIIPHSNRYIPVIHSFIQIGICIYMYIYTCLHDISVCDDIRLIIFMLISISIRFLSYWVLMLIFGQLELINTTELCLYIRLLKQPAIKPLIQKWYTRQELFRYQKNIASPLMKIYAIQQSIIACAALPILWWTWRPIHMKSIWNHICITSHEICVIYVRFYCELRMYFIRSSYELHIEFQRTSHEFYMKLNQIYSYEFTCSSYEIHMNFILTN